MNLFVNTAWTASSKVPKLRMVMHPTTTSDDSGLAYTFGKLA